MTVAIDVRVLHVEVTVVIPATHVLHGTIIVVRTGVVGIEKTLSGATGVLPGDKEGGVRLITVVLLGGNVIALVVRLVLARVVVTGTVVVIIAVEMVVFILWLQLVVSAPFVVNVLQTVQGAVIVVVNTVVVVLTAVIVEYVVYSGVEVLTIVTTEPLLSVVVVVMALVMVPVDGFVVVVITLPWLFVVVTVTGSVVELVWSAATGVDVVEDNETVAVDTGDEGEGFMIEDAVRSIAF